MLCNKQILLKRKDVSVGHYMEFGDSKYPVLLQLLFQQTHLPTTIISNRYLRRCFRSSLLISLSSGILRSFLQMSIVKIVLLLLKIDVRELIMADIITANIKPRKPEMKNLRSILHKHDNFISLCEFRFKDNARLCNTPRQRFNFVFCTHASVFLQTETARVAC